MRKIKAFLTAATLLASLAAGAQGAHLKFHGIPLGGDVKEFTSALTKKGFQVRDGNAAGTVLTGPFLGQADAVIILNTNPSNSIVAIVTAAVPAGDRWTYIEKSFVETVTLYKTKYGEPECLVEEFDGYAESDYGKLSAVREGRCKYFSSWKTDGGVISVAVKYLVDDYRIVCEYADNDAGMKYLKKILEEI